MSAYTAADIGMRVLFVPPHATAPRPRCRGLFVDADHPDCEEGVITGLNERFVFVRYGSDQHSKATRPDDLYPLRHLK